MDGKLTLLSTSTASSSATLSITSNINSSYDEYLFLIVNMHPAADNTDNAFSFQGSIDGGSNYNVAMTTTHYRAIHTEDSASDDVAFGGAFDQHQGTAFQWFNQGTDADNDASICGHMRLFQPSNTTYVKHFMTHTTSMDPTPAVLDAYMSGYFNTTSAINALQFKNTNSHNMDSGSILMFGVS